MDHQQAHDALDAPGRGYERVRWDSSADSHWALNTTIRCQHRCTYCFEGDRGGMTDLPPDDAKRLLDDAARSVRHVTFMGAEPTLNPHLPELVAHASALGMTPSISTNAIRLSDSAYLERLRQAGLSHIELSFHYPDERAYATVTRAKPRGFHRLVQALDNIEAAYQARGWPLAVNVNVVVTRLNVHRLGEVVAHIRRGLVSPPRLLTFKRVERPEEMPADEFLQQTYVPLAVLRARLAEVAAEVPLSEALAYRGFPLCAIPGQECLDLDLCYFLRGASVSDNFDDQRTMEEMYPEAKRREAHVFQSSCNACTLAAACLSRGLFSTAGSSPEDLPVPRHEPIGEAFQSFLMEFPRGRELLDTSVDEPEARAAAAIAERVARQLERADGPASRARSEGNSVVVTNANGDELARVRVSSSAGPAADGFLCGAARLEPTAESLASPSALACTAAIAACAAELHTKGALPWAGEASGFLRDVWAVFGRALLPRAGALAHVKSGRVAPERVRLGIATRAGVELDIVLSPAGDAPAFATGRGIALHYELGKGMQAGGDVLHIVRGYAALLPRSSGRRP